MASPAHLFTQGNCQESPLCFSTCFPWQNLCVQEKPPTGPSTPTDSAQRDAETGLESNTSKVSVQAHGRKG